MWESGERLRAYQTVMDGYPEESLHKRIAVFLKMEVCLPQENSSISQIFWVGSGQSLTLGMHGISFELVDQVNKQLGHTCLRIHSTLNFSL